MWFFLGFSTNNNYGGGGGKHQGQWGSEMEGSISKRKKNFVRILDVYALSWDLNISQVVGQYLSYLIASASQSLAPCLAVNHPDGKADFVVPQQK